MSRLYEALTAIEQKAHVLARTDLPGVHAEGRARHRRSVIALGAVVLFGAAWLTVMMRAPSTPSPSAPPVPPLPSAPFLALAPQHPDRARIEQRLTFSPPTEERR